MNNGYVQNPYAERMNFLQNCQQNLQPPMQNSQMQATSQQTSFIGKVVDSIDVVKATDIPMDGNIYYFPKADGTEIFGKQWLANGRTHILTFKPVLDTEPNNPTQDNTKSQIGISEEVTEVIMKRFDELENKISNLESSLTKTSTKSSTRSTKTSTTTKKESDTDA
jgi:hypothetical protein